MEHVAWHIPSPDKNLEVSGGVAAPQLGMVLEGGSPWALTLLHVSPGGHEAVGQYGVNGSCLVHGATEEERVSSIDLLTCKGQVMMGRWSSRRNQVVYGWTACTREFSSSVYLLSFKTTVQSGHYKNYFKKYPLFIPSLGLVSAFFVCMSVSAEFVVLENMIQHLSSQQETFWPISWALEAQPYRLAISI